MSVGASAFRITGELSLSPVPIPVHTCADSMCRGFTPDNWTQVAVSFAVLADGAFVGLVTAHEEDGTLRRTAFQPFGSGSGRQKAFEVVISLSGTRADQEFRILDIPPLGPPFFWLAGRDAVFVDWAEARAHPFRTVDTPRGFEKGARRRLSCRRGRPERAAGAAGEVPDEDSADGSIATRTFPKDSR